jgi:glucosaminylphosphatidylinositol acyltransferase
MTQAAILFWAVLQSRHGFFEVPSPATYLADFMLNVGGILLATTVYSSAPLALVAVLLASSAVYLLVPASRNATHAAKPRSGKKDSTNTPLSPFPIRPFLSYYRGTMLVVTCSSILAVDFPVFPRRFAKVETWGTSLMDIGVGSFVFSAGLVAAKAPLKDRQERRIRSVVARLVSALRAATPLFVLGIARLLSVKQLEYAEHVSEYGVHWNFFFTLAAVPLAMAVFEPLIEALPGPRYAMAGLALTFLHQALLSSTSLQAWALTAPRDDLLSANREGLTSTPGYLAIFLFGMSAGTAVLPRIPDSSRITTTLLSLLHLSPSKTASPSQSVDLARTRLLANLVLSSLFYSSLLLGFSLPHLLPPFLTINISRRLANAPYVLWIAAFNSAQIAVFCLVETLCFPAVRRARSPDQEKEAARFATSGVLEACNQGGLLIFLAANLGTGAVNLGLDTLNTGPYQAVAVLAVYMAGLTVLAMNLRGVKLKF